MMISRTHVCAGAYVLLIGFQSNQRRFVCSSDRKMNILYAQLFPYHNRAWALGPECRQKLEDLDSHKPKK
jgi:hypothetical protein